jgi:hypothetical protein
MKRSLIVFSLAMLGAAVALAAADPALARAKSKAAHKVRHACAERYFQFSWDQLLLGGGQEAKGNGCAPAVYSGGKYIGQDPDPAIRSQLRRDPASGYPMNFQ